MAVSRLSLVTSTEEPVAELSLDAAFRLHSPYVAGLALRVLGRNDEVEDVVHDVFLAAHRGLKTLRQPSDARAWLTAVTVRIARRRLRIRRLRSWIGLDEVTDAAAVTDPTATPHERAELAAAFRALDRVPVDDRLAWSLRHLQGESLDDVAAACGCSLATAKRRIAAAQQMLQEALR